MGYPDNLNTTALDRETSSRRTVTRRGPTMREHHAITGLQQIIDQIANIPKLLGDTDIGEDGQSYLTYITNDGAEYCRLLIAEIEAGPERDAEWERRQHEDDQNEAGRECER